MKQTKAQFTINLIFLSLIFILSSCSFQSTKEAGEMSGGNHEAKIKEVIQTTSYSYLLIEENSTVAWIACNRKDYEAGQTVYFVSGMAMQNFHSTELDRDFEFVYFVDQISLNPMSQVDPSTQVPQGMVKESARKEIQLDKVEGGISIGELFANTEEYKNSRVKVKGEVVKFNSSIMGRNWVHIQDGTGTDLAFDLTLTTQDVVNVGDIVVFSGIVTLKKDFAAGYVYEVILENSKLITDL